MRDVAERMAHGIPPGVTPLPMPGTMEALRQFQALREIEDIRKQIKPRKGDDCDLRDARDGGMYGDERPQA